MHSFVRVEEKLQDRQGEIEGLTCSKGPRAEIELGWTQPYVLRTLIGEPPTRVFFVDMRLPSVAF